MNLAQAKAAVKLLERAEELAGEAPSWGEIRLSVRDEDDRDDGSIEVSLFRGGIGAGLLIDWEGTVCGELYAKGSAYPKLHEDVEIALRDDGTFTWNAKAAA